MASKAPVRTSEIGDSEELRCVALVSRRLICDGPSLQPRIFGTSAFAMQICARRRSIGAICGRPISMARTLLAFSWTRAWLDQSPRNSPKRSPRSTNPNHPLLRLFDWALVGPGRSGSLALRASSVGSSGHIGSRIRLKDHRNSRQRHCFRRSGDCGTVLNVKSPDAGDAKSDSALLFGIPCSRSVVGSGDLC